MNSHGMHETGQEPYFYSNYTWKELREVPAERRVVLLPVGSTEDHGHHLPLDTDNYLAWTVCVDWWSTFSTTGVVGDPTLATRAKGQEMFEALLERMVELVREFRDRPRPPRQDLHAEPPPSLFGLHP